MGKTRFRISLKAAHEKKGLSPYRVMKATGIPPQTVSKYAYHDGVEIDSLFGVVIKLCEYYGVDWRDPNIIEVFEEEDSPEEGQIKTLLAASA